MFMSPFPIFRVCSQQCKCRLQKQRGEPRAASAQTEMRNGNVNTGCWKNGRIWSELENNHFLFSQKKNSRARLKESWVAWRCVGYPANNGGLLSWCCHLDECEPGTSALISGCEYQTELQINHAPWLSSFSNKDKYVEIEDELSPLKAKL